MRRLLALCLTLSAAVTNLRCQEIKPPAHRETVFLEGTAYARGFTHGQKLSTKIKSFYTTTFTASLFPYLSREQPNLATLLKEYSKDAYLEGRFAYQVLLESAKRQEKSIPRALREEMKGIADGSGMSYEQILILNTFVDSVLSIQGLASALAFGKAPRLQKIELLGTVNNDGIDNDNDNLIDEPDEASFDYEPSDIAARVELPIDVRFRFTLRDSDGINAQFVRVQLNEEIFDLTSSSIQADDDPKDASSTIVTFTPPKPLTAGTRISLVLSAGDRAIVESPSPAHANFMRAERLAFTLKGFGKKRFEVPNSGALHVTEEAPAWALALRGTATKTGQPLLATSFSLLDGDSAHKHTALFVHHPSNGKPFAYVGWAGLVWGFSGLNSEGVALACTYSESLDSTVVGNLIEQIANLDNAKLISSGTPIGVAIRNALERSTDAMSAIKEIGSVPHTFGWNCLSIDAQSHMRAIEVDADVSRDGFFQYTADEDTEENVNSIGAKYASVRQDDLRIGSHFRKNASDMLTLPSDALNIQPQKYWSSFYFRSVRVFSMLGERIFSTYGAFDKDEAIALLRDSALNNQRDGMNAVVFEPSKKRIYSAMGQVPPAAGEFMLLEDFQERQP